jgi:S1-C subfamily serine protease
MMHDPGRQSPRHLVRLSWLLVVVLLLLRPQQTSAQGATTWGWGRQQQVFDPELFADYLLSGQTPHPAVARIVAPEPGGVSLGSGVLVDANATQGLVLTNWHVIRDSRSAVLVQFPDGFQSAGTVIRFDEAWDLAAISIWKPSATPVSLARRNPALGEPLSIAGYGRGSYRAQAGRCTEYLSPGAGYPRELVELAAPARQGDSGGPILDADGRLAGVLFGEGEGRTVGSCVSRLRVFLASVGSDGFVPPAQVAGATAPAQAQVANQPQAAVAPSAVSHRGPPVQPTAVSLSRSTALPQSLPQQPAEPLSTKKSPGWLSAGELAIPPEVLAHFNVFTNSQSLLTAAGGLSLVLVGLRLIWRSRQ